MSEFAPLQADSSYLRAGVVDREHRHRLQIPWGLHAEAWRAYAAFGHGDQSAARIAERGGFSAKELVGLLSEPPFYGRRHLDAQRRELLERLREEGAES